MLTELRRKDNKMFERQTIQLNNVTLEWPFLGMINDKGNFPTHKYQVDIIMDDEQLKIFNSVKHPRQQAKKREDGKWKITVKSSKAPRVVDANRMPMDIEVVKKIGNGTVATVKLNTYLGYMNTPFIGLEAVKVNELKEYTKGSSSDGWDDDGYTSPVMPDDDIPF